MDLIGRRERCRSGPFTTRGLTVELLGRGIKSDRRAVWVFLHAEGLSFKKTVRPAEQMRPDIARKRTRWKARQGRVEPGRLVFIDETWVKTNMAPLRGWDRADRGSRLACRTAMCGRPLRCKKNLRQALRVIGCCHVSGL